MITERVITRKQVKERWLMVINVLVEVTYERAIQKSSERAWQRSIKEFREVWASTKLIVKHKKGEVKLKKWGGEW